jgi:hypothetical protein
LSALLNGNVTCRRNFELSVSGLDLITELYCTVYCSPTFLAELGLRTSAHVALISCDTTRGRTTLPLSPTHWPFALSARIMSETHPTASSSSSNFQLVLYAALEAYERKTKCKLLANPLATQLQSCESPTAVLSVLQDIIQQFDRRRASDERLSNWLNPTINVLYAFSSTIGQGVGLVSPISSTFLESVT